MNWYDKVFRKVHWDFDNPSFVKNIGESFNPDRFVATLKEAKVEAINFFAKDVLGHSYYDTEVGYKHPGLERDLLKEVTEICHKNGIKVIFYYVALDEHIIKLHPDWRLIRIKEVTGEVLAEVTVNFICFNSGYLDELVISQIKELAR